MALGVLHARAGLEALALRDGGLHEDADREARAALRRRSRSARRRSRSTARRARPPRRAARASRRGSARIATPAPTAAAARAREVRSTEIGGLDQERGACERLRREDPRSRRLRAEPLGEGEERAEEEREEGAGAPGRGSAPKPATAAAGDERVDADHQARGTQARQDRRLRTRRRPRGDYVTTMAAPPSVCCTHANANGAARASRRVRTAVSGAKQHHEREGPERERRKRRELEQDPRGQRSCRGTGPAAADAACRGARQRDSDPEVGADARGGGPRSGTKPRR